MSIKPVAWMRPNGTHVDYYRHEGYLPLYAIPDTHRLVPVEVLQATMTGAYPFELKLCEKIRALIEDKP